jgi:hypothetical protein
VLALQRHMGCKRQLSHGSRKLAPHAVTLGFQLELNCTDWTCWHRMSARARHNTPTNTAPKAVS